MLEGASTDVMCSQQIKPWERGQLLSVPAGACTACWLCQPAARGDIHRSEKVKNPNIFFFFLRETLAIQAWQGVHKMPYAASLGPPFSYPPVLFHLLTCSQMLTIWSSYSDLKSSKFNISLSKEHQHISGKMFCKIPKPVWPDTFRKQCRFIILYLAIFSTLFN